MSREKWVLIGAGAIAVALVAVVLVLRAQSPSSQQQASDWATQACAHYAPDAAVTIGPDGRPVPTSTLTPQQEVASWQTAADDAAHAARLDPAWQNLAMATNAQLEGWQQIANGQMLSQDVLAASAQYNINVECRKAKA